MIEKTFLNPATNKKWRIEIDGHIIRTCLNGGKVKEILCDSAFQVKSKAASAMMGQMRKGFVYQNPDAAVGQARCHRFVGKDSNGFMQDILDNIGPTAEVRKIIRPIYNFKAGDEE